MADLSSSSPTSSVVRHSQHPRTSFFQSMLDDTSRFGKDLVALAKIGKRDRKKRYETLLDHCPLWVLLAVNIFIILFIVLTLAIGIIAPSGTDIRMQSHLVGKQTTISQESGYVSPASMEMYFFLRLGFNASVTGIHKSDFKMTATLSGRYSKDDPWTLIGPPDAPITRALTCNAYGTYDMDDPTPRDPGEKNKFCRDVIVHHVRWLQYRYYKVDLNIRDKVIEDLANRGFFNGVRDEGQNYVFYTGFRTNNEDYMVFEIISRLVFSIVSAVALMSFTLFTCLHQDIRHWHTYQRWLLPLLAFLVFYHNPLFVIQVFSSIAWLFSIFHIIMSSTFIYTFMLYMLVFTHSLFKKPKERKFLTFYLNKIILVGAMWIVTIVMLSVSRWYNWDDPAQLGRQDIPLVQFLSYALALLGLFFAVYLIYYLVRAISSRNTIPKKYSSRFKVVVGFSLFVLIAMLSVFIIRVGFRYSSAGLEYFVPNASITLYFVLLSAFFLPSSHVHPRKYSRSGAEPTTAVPQHEPPSPNDREMEQLDRPVEEMGMGHHTGGQETYDEERDYEFDDEDEDMYANAHRLGEDSYVQRL